MRKIILLSMLGLVVCGPAPAHAAFYIDKSGEAVQTASAQAPLSAQESSKARIIHVGTIPAEIAAAKGMGEDIPMSLAVQQIMPDGWAVYFDEGEGKDRLVSWTGSDVWVKSLERVLVREDGTAKIDWTRKVVTIKVAVIKEEILPTETISMGSTAKAAATERVWQVRYTDGNIQGTLRRWAEESGEGWQISWESPMEFPTVLEAEFIGSFRDAVDGVVSALISSEAPVWARYYNNKVVRIVPAGTKTE